MFFKELVRIVIFQGFEDFVFTKSFNDIYFSEEKLLTSNFFLRQLHAGEEAIVILHMNGLCGLLFRTVCRSHSHLPDERQLQHSRFHAAAYGSSVIACTHAFTRTNR